MKGKNTKIRLLLTVIIVLGGGFLIQSSLHTSNSKNNLLLNTFNSANADVPAPCCDTGGGGK